ncbi:BLUF domain-containing protein [uncultured Hymenobacter sp.]|uniref:BLUF domain-containing protein n=1 Tax=uncultured Hymenobacter sp. TaxID=170016 RepID=UPI0035CA0CAD
MEELSDEVQRRRAVEWAIALTTDTPLAPLHYERQLLELYAQGEVTLQHVLRQLDTRVHHILYRSQAVALFSEAQLLTLLDESRAWNEVHGITGLLCYSAGHFVQLLEGSASDVLTLYARIRRDPRHRRVVLLSEGAKPTRLFADWRMASVLAEPLEFYWVTSQLEVEPHLDLPYIPITEPHLLTLLQAFSKEAR